jgi:hypothetical protein
MAASKRIGASVVLIASFLASEAFAQPPGLPPQPIPMPPQPSGGGPAPVPPQPSGGVPGPPVFGQPSPLEGGQVPTIPVPPTYPPNNSPVVPVTPIFGNPAAPLPPPVPLQPPPSPTPGWYGSLELLLIYPHLYGTLGGTTTVGGIPQSFSVTNPRLDTTGSPQVEIGYRLGDGLGAFAATYRSVVSSGGFNAPNWDPLGEGFVSTRLNMNVLDLDYVSPAYNFMPFWDIAWRVGARGAAVYFDDQIIGQLIDASASNNFIGAGPHATVEVARILDVIPGLAITSKLDGGVLVGQVTQSFDTQYNFGPGMVVGGATRFHEAQSVPMLTYQLGLSYTPPGWVNWARFGFGYQFEYWWDVGTAGSSHNDFFGNSIYFRGEINF